MEIRRFSLASYLGAEDVFHAVVKDIAGPRPRFLHDHDYFELMVVLDGALRHEMPGRADVLAPGTAVFLRPTDAHLIQAPKRARILNVMVRPAIVADLGCRHAACATRFFWSDAPYPEALVLSPAARGRLAGGGVLLRDGPTNSLRLEAFLAGLLADLTAEGQAFDADLPTWLARACRAALSPDVFRDGAAGLARVSGRSHEHLCRAMRRHFGQTPSAWVNGVRMDHAARLIRDSPLPVAEVADAVGIGNAGHFYRLFRAHHGETPKAFRTKARRAPV